MIVLKQISVMHCRFQTLRKGRAEEEVKEVEQGKKCGCG